MASPTKVSRKAFEGFAGVRWNAMNDMMALSDIRDLTPIQRAAHLAWWYMSEAYNGGHEQFISNHADLDHLEVVQALETVGAIEQAGILRDFLAAVTADPSGARRTVLDYLEHGPGVDSSRHDAAFGNCMHSVESCLEDYLDKHERDFIEWTP
ncbi:MAG: DUF4375 domain-containing protein [Verrucomicrobiales bacterium]|nr:DUF4375 domain-containing protein [Verrucomicrobiales bacterium]